MSYKNPTKGELIAIYRLEFYKNQNKWKFSKNERKLKKDAVSKQKLNETYRVEDEESPEAEPLEPLNDAFLETDSDENVKEELKVEPPPLMRRWKNTILDMKVTDADDWAVESPGWGTNVEPVRSYEDEWGEDGGEVEGDRWGDDMQCVEQVYASEVCVSRGRPRLPVFAGWPATDQHTATSADHDMLQHLVQNLGGGGQKGQRQNVAETLRQQMEQNVGPMGQNFGQTGQNNGQQLRQNIEHNMGQNTGQLGQNFGQNLAKNVDQNVRQNIGRAMGQNIIQNMLQNVRYMDPSTEKTMMPNTGQNVEYLGQDPGHDLRQIFERNLKQDMMEFEEMEWEPERDCCGLGQGVEVGGDDVDGGCKGGVGDACVAGAVAALAEAEGWLTGELKHFYLQPAVGEAPSAPPRARDVSQWSGDSASFVRGAHARPHSSEVDLTDTPCQCASLSSSKLAHMSGAALRDALRVYTAAAHRVIHELRLRSHAHQQASAVSCDATHESLPTRDVSAGRGRGRRLLTK